MYRIWASATSAMRDADARRFGSDPARGPRPSAAPRVPALAQRRRGDDCGLQLAVPLGGDERPEDRDAADVVVGAVDRVDVPAGGRLPRVGAVLLADHPVAGERGGDPVPHEALDPAVGLGDEGRVGLPLHGDVASERAHRDGICLVAPGERGLDPTAQLGVRAAPEPGAPLGPELGAHAQILAPSGSHSGSRAISNPIHSPNTSTSPRVPIAARSGGR